MHMIFNTILYHTTKGSMVQTGAGSFLQGDTVNL